MPIVLDELEKVGLHGDFDKAGDKNEEGITFRKLSAKRGETLADFRYHWCLEGLSNTNLLEFISDSTRSPKSF